MKKYTYELTGQGLEIVVGSVEPETYEFFQESLEDGEDILSEYIDDYESVDIPDEHQIFGEEGQWYCCDDIAHESGPLLNDSMLKIFDDTTGDCIYEISLTQQNIEQLGIEFEIIDTIESTELAPGFYYSANQIERGTFMDSVLEIDHTFDPKNLVIHCTQVNSNIIINFVSYLDHELESDAYDTWTKSFDYELFEIEN